MLELAVVALTVISVGLYLRLRDVERRLDVFDTWADWIEDEFITREPDMIFELNFDEGEENHGSEDK